MRSSPGRDLNLQPPDSESGTLHTATSAPIRVLILSHVWLSILSPTVELIMNVISGVCTACMSRVTHIVVDAVWMC